MGVVHTDNFGRIVDEFGNPIKPKPTPGIILTEGVKPPSLKIKGQFVQEEVSWGNVILSIGVGLIILFFSVMIVFAIKNSYNPTLYTVEVDGGKYLHIPSYLIVRSYGKIQPIEIRINDKKVIIPSEVIKLIVEE